MTLSDEMKSNLDYMIRKCGKLRASQKIIKNSLVVNVLQKGHPLEDLLNTEMDDMTNAMLKYIDESDLFRSMNYISDSLNNITDKKMNGITDKLLNRCYECESENSNFTDLSLIGPEVVVPLRDVIDLLANIKLK